MSNHLTTSFFAKKTTTVAKELIGKECHIKHNNIILKGIINETEAYTQEDPSCHAFNGKKTKRNLPMFSKPGTIYMYFIYGLYYCLNIVTEKKGRGCAVLIRSIIPSNHFDIIKNNRPHSHQKNWANGPGKLVLAFDIPFSINNTHLSDSKSILTVQHTNLKPTDLKETPRIGIKKGKHLNWRFIANSFTNNQNI